MRRTTLLIASLLILGLTPSAEADDGLVDMESQGPPQCFVYVVDPPTVDEDCAIQHAMWLVYYAGPPLSS